MDLQNSGESHTPLWGEQRRSLCSRNKTPDLRLQTVNRRPGREINRAVIRVPPIEISRRFRQHDGAQVLAIGIPDPDSSRTGAVDIPLHVHAHTIGNTAAAFFLAEYSAVAQLHTRANVVDANLAQTRVIHVKALAIGRKCQTI